MFISGSRFRFSPLCSFHPASIIAFDHSFGKVRSSRFSTAINLQWRPAAPAALGSAHSRHCITAALSSAILVSSALDSLK